VGGSINLLEVVDNPFVQELLKAIAERSGLLVDGKPTYEILRTEMFKAVADALVLDAGVAAAVSLQANRTCRQVDIARVQSILAAQGVRLD
jgi:hypothetical protein